MKEYIDLFTHINELLIRLITLGEIIFLRLNFILEENALSEYPQLVIVVNRTL